MKGPAKLISGIADRLWLPPIRRFVPLQTFRYAVCGVSNNLLSWLLYFIAYYFVFGQQNFDLGLFVLSPHIASLAAVFPITLLIGFYLNKYVAFRESPLRGQTQLMRYVLSVSGSLVLNALFLKLFVEAFHLPAMISEMIATLITTVYSYLMQKYFTFRGCAEK